MMISNILPHEIELKIIDNLGSRDLKSFARVCKASYEYVNTNQCWIKFFPGPRFYRFTHHGTKLKQKFAGISVYSRRDINQILKNFIKELQLDQIGIFKCQFPLNPRFHFDLQIQFINVCELKKVTRVCCYESKLPEKNIMYLFKNEKDSFLIYNAILRPWGRDIIKCAEREVAKKIANVWGIQLYAIDLRMLINKIMNFVIENKSIFGAAQYNFQSRLNNLTENT